MLSTALSRRMTQLELRNVWNYKYCFEVKSDENRDGKNYFSHKKYSIAQIFANISKFLIGQNVVGKGGKIKVGIKMIKGDAYEDIRSTI